MPDTATLSARFQLLIPKRVRDSHHWQAGQEFGFIPRGKGVLIIPVPETDELRGLASGADPHGYRNRSDRV